MSLRILQICPKPPFPAVDGGCIAANTVTEGLLNLGHSVKVIALNTPKHPPHVALENADYLRRTSFETCFQNTNVSPVAAFRHLLSDKSYNIERFYSKKFEQLLVSSIASNDFDVIHFESAYTASYLAAIRKVTSAPTVYRSHNMEFEIWRGTQALETNPLRRAYIGLLASQMERFERRIANCFDGVATITNADKNTLLAMGCTAPIETVPFSLDLSKISSKVDSVNNSVFHLGSMDWLPNQDGIRWFLKEVWPKVTEEFPRVRLFLAGRSMPDWMVKMRSLNVEIVGEVDNAYDFMASHSVMVVPLHSGGGMRIKIVEALALRKAIVSTSLGAAGIDYIDGEHLFVADSASVFADRINRLLADPAMCAQLADNAQKLARQTYDNDVVIGRLVRFYESLISRKQVVGA